MARPIYKLRELYKRPGLYVRDGLYGTIEWWWLEIKENRNCWWRQWAQITGKSDWSDQPWPPEDLQKSNPLEYLLLTGRVFNEDEISKE
jgi:hypothetical protein